MIFIPMVTYTECLLTQQKSDFGRDHHSSYLVNEPIYTCTCTLVISTCAIDTCIYCTVQL